MRLTAGVLLVWGTVVRPQPRGRVRTIVRLETILDLSWDAVGTNALEARNEGNVLRP